MKVLVTGGTGFIGSNLAICLARNGDSVTICDNNFRGRFDSHIHSMIEKYDVKYIECDMTNAEELEKFDHDYDEIYHLAAINGTGNFYEIPEEVLRVNILSVLNLLEWIGSHNVKSKLLFSSSSEAYAGTVNKLIPTPETVHLSIDDVFNPRFSYAGSKIVGELLFINYARKYNLDFRIARYHNVYGPRMGFKHVIPQLSYRAIERMDPYKLFGGDQSRTFCYIDDAARATVMTMRGQNSNGQVINIGSGQETKILEVARIILELADYDPKNIAENYAPPGSTERRCPDVTKLAELGFTPKVDLSEGIERTFLWYKEYYENLSK